MTPTEHLDAAQASLGAATANVLRITDARSRLTAEVAVLAAELDRLTLERGERLADEALDGRSSQGAQWQIRQRMTEASLDHASKTAALAPLASRLAQAQAEELTARARLAQVQAWFAAPIAARKTNDVRETWRLLCSQLQERTSVLESAQRGSSQDADVVLLERDGGPSLIRIAAEYGIAMPREIASFLVRHSTPATLDTLRALASPDDEYPALPVPPVPKCKQPKPTRPPLIIASDGRYNDVPDDYDSR